MISLCIFCNGIQDSFGCQRYKCYSNKSVGVIEWCSIQEQRFIFQGAQDFINALGGAPKQRVIKGWPDPT